MYTIIIRTPINGLIFPMRMGSEVIAYKTDERDNSITVTFRSVCLDDLKMSRKELHARLEAEGWSLSRSGVIYEDLAEICAKTKVGNAPRLATIAIERSSKGWKFLTGSFDLALIKAFVQACTPNGSPDLFSSLTELTTPAKSKK